MKIIFRLIDFLFINLIRERFIRHLFEYHIHLNSGCAEFGVYKGTTARFIAKHSGGRFLFLFDSFEGLPESWNRYYKKGDFKLKKIPNLPVKSTLFKGQFKASITDFKNIYENYKLSFIHIDSDLYSSAKEVLFRLNDNIVPGTVLLFDEFLRGENTAFNEWLNNFARKCILLKKTIHLQAAYLVIK